MGAIKLHDYFDSNKKTRNLKKYTLKEFLLFFNLNIEELIYFVNEVQENKQFILNHKEQFYSLTGREKEIFKLVVEGKRTDEIAAKLFIETSTVSTHRKKIKQKLDLQSNYDWYHYAKIFKVLRF